MTARGVTEIWVEKSGGRWSCGSGYAIGGRLILTAAHVLGDGPRGVKHIRVRLLRAGELLDASVAWDGRGLDRPVDAALLTVTDERWDPPSRPERWGRLVTDLPRTPCEAWGFPSVLATPEVRDVEQASGSINPGTLRKSAGLAIRIDDPPARVRGSASPWAGMSGAAVWCHGLLTALVVTDPAGFDSRRLVAVPVTAFLREPRVRELLREHACHYTVEPVELTPLTTPTTVQDSPAALLRADVAPMRFRSRPELDQLREWCESEPLTAARLVTGPGGQGKTRMARELAAELTERGWACVFVADTAPVDGLPALGQVNVPCLVVIDYAESRLDQLGRLADALVYAQARLRVLMLARTAGPWREELTTRGPNLGMFARAEVIQLSTLEPTTDGRVQAWEETVTALAPALEDVDGYRNVDWAAAKTATLETAPVLTGPRFDTILGIQIDALAKLLQAGDPAPDPAGSDDESMTVLIEHERRYWTRVADRTAGVPRLPATLLERAVACASLWGADTETEAVAVLATVAGLTSLGEHERIGLAQVLGQLYQQSRWWNRLQPDRLAEHLISRQLRTDASLFRNGLAASSPQQTRNALTVLIQAAVHEPELNQIVIGAADAGGAALGVAAMTVAPRAERPEALLELLDNVAASADHETLRDLHDHLPDTSTVLASTSAAITGALVDSCRSLAEAVPDSYLPDLAMSLTNLAIRLGDIGRHQHALAPAQEAVGHYRQLAAANPDTHLPNLAASLTNLAGALGDIDQHQQALAPAQEATDHYRQLAAANPDTHLPHFAASLNNLANRLDDTGHHQQALQIAQEAVTIRRELVDAKPDAYLPGLAESLNNLAFKLASTGQREQALGPAREATDHYRQLAAASPDTHLPNLATSLNNLAIRLGDTGHDQRALEIARESVTINRELVEAGPDAYLADLARSLNTLANALARRGQHEQAVSTTQESVTVRRKLARTNPDSYLPDLAASLTNLANRLSDIGQHQQGLALAREATDLYRKLSRAAPGTHLPNLAASLNNLASHLDDNGHHEQARATGQEAVDHFRQLGAAQPGVYEDRIQELVAWLQSSSG